jgi:3-hydroxyacyl-CoA dehydrogenase
VVRGAATSSDVADRVTALLRTLGKRPVAVRRDVLGFVWNRLQLALLREAVWLTEAGVASPEEVDRVVREGLARRWRLIGPFETVALGGAETFERIAANLLPALSDATALPGLRRWLDETPETLARVRRERDLGLAEELRRDRAAGGQADAPE